MRSLHSSVAIVTLLAFGFPGTARAVEIGDLCDVGGGMNDIKSLSATYDAYIDEIAVDMTRCNDLGQPGNSGKYRVYFEYTTPFTIDTYRGGSGEIDNADNSIIISGLFNYIFNRLEYLSHKRDDLCEMADGAEENIGYVCAYEREDCVAQKAFALERRGKCLQAIYEYRAYIMRNKKQ